jgi:ribose-phosphate pyrophosphokinase
VAKVLQEQGAKKIFAACTHGVLSGKAVSSLEASPIEKLFVTNTIMLNEEKRSCKKIVQLSIAEMLAIAIKKIHIGESISLLFR